LRKWIVLGALIVLVAPGCTKPVEKETGGRAESQMKPESGDDKIAKAVKDKFAADAKLKSEPIEVAVKDGRVTLNGTVSDDSVRAKADELAREVPDVFGVDAEKLVTK
jgi:osmotically-inducible protein OsmY